MRLECVMRTRCSPGSSSTIQQLIPRWFLWLAFIAQCASNCAVKQLRVGISHQPVMLFALREARRAESWLYSHRVDLYRFIVCPVGFLVISYYVSLWDCETRQQADEVPSPRTGLCNRFHHVKCQGLYQEDSLQAVSITTPNILLLFSFHFEGLPFLRAPWRRWSGSSDVSVRRYEAATPSTSLCPSWLSRSR